MAGGKTKLTQEKIELIKELLEEGHFATTVQRAIGISDRGWYNWKDTGEAIQESLDNEEREEADLTEYESLCLQFVQTIKEAEAVAEMKALNSITKASLKQWQAAAWFLERKHKDRWGKDNGDGNGSGQNALDKFLTAMERAADQALDEEEEEDME